MQLINRLMVKVQAVKARAMAVAGVAALALVAPAAHAGNFTTSANTIPDLTTTLTAAQNSGGAAVETYGPALVGVLAIFLVFRFAWKRLKQAFH